MEAVDLQKQIHCFNLQPVIDKVHFYAKDPFEAKSQFLIKKREDVEIKHFNHSKTLKNVKYELFLMT